MSLELMEKESRLQLMNVMHIQNEALKQVEHGKERGTSLTDNVENLILEMLKGVRSDVKEFRSRYEEDVDDLKAHMSSLENAMISVKREVTHGDEVDARQQVSLGACRT